MRMKVAIPMFGNRISPRFDFSPEIWLVELKNGEMINQEKLTTSNLNLPQRLDQLVSVGVNRMICGGIDGFSIGQLGNRGIDVIHNVAGEAEEALNLFIRGLLQPGCYCERKRGRRSCSRRGRMTASLMNGKREGPKD